MQLRNSFTGSLTRMGIIVALVVFALLFIAIGLIVDVAFGASRAADNVAPCLTKEQARAKWPKEWIYWHGMNHCWDNVRGTANTANKADGTVHIIRAPKSNRAAKSGKLPPVDGNGNEVHPSSSPPVAGRGPTIFYPTLMSGGGTDDINMLRGEAMQTWPAIADFDVEPPVFLPWLQRATTLINR